MQCWICTVSHKCFCVYAEGCRREKALLARFSWRGVSFKDTSHGHASRRVDNLSILWPRPSSDYCFCALCLHNFTYLISRSSSALSRLNASQAPLTVRIPGFKPQWLQELTKVQPSCFSSQWLWWTLLLVHSSMCLSLSLFLIHDHWSIPSSVAMIHASPNYICTLFAFFEVASSLPLVVGFVLSVFRSFRGA